MTDHECAKGATIHEEFDPVKLSQTGHSQFDRARQLFFWLGMTGKSVLTAGPHPSLGILVECSWSQG